MLIGGAVRTARMDKAERDGLSEETDVLSDLS
jgi:hypothetical protein